MTWTGVKKIFSLEITFNNDDLKMRPNDIICVLLNFILLDESPYRLKYTFDDRNRDRSDLRSLILIFSKGFFNT